MQIGFLASSGSATESSAALLFIVSWVGGDPGGDRPGRLCGLAIQPALRDFDPGPGTSGKAQRRLATLNARVLIQYRE